MAARLHVANPGMAAERYTPRSAVTKRLLCLCVCVGVGVGVWVGGWVCVGGCGRLCAHLCACTGMCAKPPVCPCACCAVSRLKTPPQVHPPRVARHAVLGPGRARSPSGAAETRRPARLAISGGCRKGLYQMAGAMRRMHSLLLSS
jgi:hypothetical protein